MSSGEEDIDYPDTPPEYNSPGINLRSRKCPRKPTQLPKRIEEDGATGFSHPATNSKRVATQMRGNEITTNNQFQVLTDDEAESEDHAESEEPEREQIAPNAETATTNTAPTKTPPPIVIGGKPEGRNLLTSLRNLAPKGFYIKNTKNATQIHAKDERDRKTIMQWLESKQIPHHTYTVQQERTYGYVLEGLDDIDPTEIAQELKQEHKIPVTNVYPMKNTHIPKYLVIVKTGTTLKQLEQKVKVVNYTLIKWKRHYNNRRVTQCHRCQRWGHATSNCHQNWACLKCAQGHPTKDCAKSTAEPATCVNCKQHHPANYTGCPAYQEIITRLTARQPVMQAEPRQRYIPAPPPQVPAWPRPTTSQTVPVPEHPGRSNNYQAPMDEFPLLGGRGPRNNQQGRETGPTEEEFVRWETEPAAQAPRTRDQSSRSREPNRQEGAHNSQAESWEDMRTLQGKVKQLSELVDFKTVIEQITQLITELQNTRSQTKKFKLFVDFIGTLNFDE